MNEIIDHPTRAQIDRLQAEMLRMPQVDIPTVHTFGPGFYARTIKIGRAHV